MTRLRRPCFFVRTEIGVLTASFAIEVLGIGISIDLPDFVGKIVLVLVRLDPLLVEDLLDRLRYGGIRHLRLGFN